MTRAAPEVFMWHTYHAPATVSDALDLLARYGDACRLISGGTDLILEIERGVRQQDVLVDLSRIPGSDRIERTRLPDGRDALVLGPNVTHNQVVACADAVQGAFPLARACWLVGAPQIRNRGTVAGNVVTASPANDTITPLWALDATVTLVSQKRGERTLSFPEFFLGVRRTALQPDEMLLHITVPLLRPNERGTFLKFGLRQAQAISLVNVAAIIDVTGAFPARIALGAVAPTIVRAPRAEAFLQDSTPSREVIETAAQLAADAARPISDIRASADYRRDLVRVLTRRALEQLYSGTEREGWPEKPVLLWGNSDGHQRSGRSDPTGGAISLRLNGRPVTLWNAGGKTLLRALREDAGLIGTKEGCAEGECGACTVWLDGVAVMSCLVPAERADGCSVTTVEGLGTDYAMHPLQKAFINAGAVQCGYCTPGILMSAVNLLEEVEHPGLDQVKEALTGNLCRCTGYYKILDAIERVVGGKE
jgi:xanthine dehydrogenase iron-sulfur cluster and FAD-binding subunit A